MNQVKQIATSHFRRVDSKGKVTEWHQEDENAVKSKAEAIGMIQRTIDFWMNMMFTKFRDIGIPAPEATRQIKEVFQRNLIKTLRDPFPTRWGIVFEDFTFDTLEEIDDGL